MSAKLYKAEIKFGNYSEEMYSHTLRDIMTLWGKLTFPCKMTITEYEKDIGGRIYVLGGEKHWEFEKEGYKNENEER